MRQVGNIVCMWERTGAYKVLVGKPEGKRPLGRPRCRWKDNNKMDLQCVGWGGGLGPGTWKRGNKISVSTKSREFLEQLRTS
jgi:hypothetical protein